MDPRPEVLQSTVVQGIGHKAKINIYLLLHKQPLVLQSMFWHWQGKACTNLYKQSQGFTEYPRHIIRLEQGRRYICQNEFGVEDKDSMGID